MAGNLLGTLWSFRGEAQLHHALADVLRSLRVPQYVGNITEIEKTFILRTYLIGLYTNIHINQINSALRTFKTLQRTDGILKSIF